MRGHLFVLLVGIFLAALAAISARYALHSRRSSQAGWEELLGQLAPMDRKNIAAVALDAISETGEPRHGDEAFALPPEAIWNLLGGMDGLEILDRNCHVLIELATYVQRWHPEALVVAEQLRLNAREIEWHIARLKGAERTGHLQDSFAAYAQRAVATYYLMTRHLLDLYEQVHFPELHALREAI